MNKINEIVSGIRYSTYVIFHPFKGFWDLKKEGKGNLGAAISLICTLVLVYVSKALFTGYLFNAKELKDIHVLSQMSSVILTFLLWCVANWCITTLVDGEGTLKDIVITTAFATTPYILIQTFMIVLSNVIVLDETVFYSLFNTLSIGWTVFLLVIGIMTVHQFSVSKTLGTILIALVGMVIIVFLFILLFALVQQIINFVILFSKELAVRNDWR